MNKKIAAILSLISLAIILAAIPLTTRLTQEKQEIRIEAVPATTLTILPPSSDQMIGSIFTIAIGIDSGANAVFGADLEILFDPLVLEVQDVQGGTFFTDPREITEIIDNTTGRVFYSLGSFTSKTGSGALASIVFRAKAGGSSPISFGPETSVAAEGEEEGLATTQDGMVTVIDKVNLSLKIKFQGINQQKPDQTVRIQLKKAGILIHEFTNFIVTSDLNGFYSGTVTDITPDTYDVYIKGWVHLTKKFSGVPLEDVDNNFDWSGVELLSGDATGDDLINIQDFGILVQDYLKSISPADFNLDGKVNIQDFRFIAENYLKEGDI